MVLVNLLSVMVNPTKAFIRMTVNTVMEFFPGLMVSDMRDGGPMGSKMVTEFLLISRRSNLEFGKMVLNSKF